MTTLLDFKYRKKFVAEDGGRGGGQKCYGRDGEDLYVKVPMGTIVREEETNKIMCDLSHKGQELCSYVRGGKGGKGNTKFATRHKTSTKLCRTRNARRRKIDYS